MFAFRLKRTLEEGTRAGEPAVKHDPRLGWLPHALNM